MGKNLWVEEVTEKQGLRGNSPKNLKNPVIGVERSRDE
jgi:hypothetical protein